MAGRIQFDRNCIYAVPAVMDCVLRVDTGPSTPLSIGYIGGDFQDIDYKWQGGFVGTDDCAGCGHDKSLKKI